MIENINWLDVPPWGVGLKTLTRALPTAATSLRLIDAVSWPLFTKLVGRGESFQLTTDEEMKLLPFTVKVKPDAPAVT
jgi:hypothetical protein